MCYTYGNGYRKNTVECGEQNWELSHGREIPASQQDWDNVVERDGGDHPAQEVVRRNELATVERLD